MHFYRHTSGEAAGDATYDELELSRSTITRFLNSLEARGFLVRKASEDDGRELEIHPTAKALDLQQTLDETAAALTKGAIDILGKQTFSDTVAKLREIRSSLEKGQTLRK